VERSVTSVLNSPSPPRWRCTGEAQVAPPSCDQDSITDGSSTPSTLKPTVKSKYIAGILMFAGCAFIGPLSQRAISGVW